MHLPIFSEVHYDVTEAIHWKCWLHDPLFEADRKQSCNVLHVRGAQYVFNKWESWFILVFLNITFYQFIFSSVYYCFSAAALLKLVSVVLSTTFSTDPFKQGWWVVRFHFLACLKCLYLFLMCMTFSLCSQSSFHQNFKDRASQSSAINYRWWGQWDIIIFLNPVYNLLFSQGDLGLSFCPWCSEILWWCQHDACGIFHVSCLGLVHGTFVLRTHVFY